MLKSRWRWALAAGMVFAVGAWGACWWVPLPERLAQPGSPVLAWSDGTAAHVTLSPDEKWRIPVGLDAIDPDYVDALLRLEDKRFYGHPGVDPIALSRAVVQNVGQRRVVSGASTITMQVVRLVEPRPRTLRSKVVEALRAIQLEVRLSKAEILSAYLGLVPYGRNVEGVEAASWAYFGHSAQALDPAEIATLLAVPQAPTTRYPAPGHAERLKAARDEVAERLLAEGALPTGSADAPRTPEEVLEQVRAARVPTALRPLPREAPHAATWLRATHPRDRLHTTLDRGVQALAERVLARHRESAEQQGIHNASVVVVEHATGQVRGLVGSFDFWDIEHGGQIVGFDNPRSPGSTLKPFVYTRAIDRGLVLPEHLRPDIPVHYGTYAPENYDGDFDGVVTMEAALSRSLNVPFVNLLSDVGVEPFLGDLRAMGVRSLSPLPGYYGLSAAVGGIELTPLEVAGLYSTLAEQGTYRPLTVLEGAPSRSRQMFAPGAAWLTQRALRLKDRPDFPSRRYLTSAPRRIHWKTGTSFGHRDAWAVGSGQHYTVAVWMGNFDNTPSIHLVGSEAAGPVLFDVLEALGDAADEVLPPADLAKVTVCALSGHLPGPACAEQREVLALEHAVPTTVCPFHQTVEVDVASGLAVGPGCRDGLLTEQRSYVLWPSAVRRWLDDRRRYQPGRPAPSPACGVLATGEPPRVLSPEAGSLRMLIAGVDPTDQEVALEAESGVADAELSWFVDGEWLGSAAADERLWWTPRPGVHEVLVMDERGQVGRSRFEVR